LWESTIEGSDDQNNIKRLEEKMVGDASGSSGASGAPLCIFLQGYVDIRKEDDEDA
jgi:hypothetical protein